MDSTLTTGNKMDYLTKTIKDLHLAQLAQRYENMGYEFLEYQTIHGVKVDAYATNGKEEMIFIVLVKEDKNKPSSNEIYEMKKELVRKFPSVKIILSPTSDSVVMGKTKEISFAPNMTIKPYVGDLEEFVLSCNYHTGLQLEKLERNAEVHAHDIIKYVHLDTLDQITKEWLVKENISISNFSIHKLIEEDEISGRLYKVLPQFASKHPIMQKEHFVLHLDSDSDFFGMTFCFFIDLFSGETFIGDM